MSKRIGNHIIKVEVAPLAEYSTLTGIMDRIRYEWKSKRLIERVNKLLKVDPSSACQRMFNAAVHDLKEKIVVAGLDIAQQVAEQIGLPIIKKEDDVEKLDVKKTISLAYGMGLLSRPEWRRLSRCYDIRRDLEHEDDEYEATPEDCLYMFITTIDVVLSKDPIHIIKIEDIKAIVQQPSVATLGDDVLTDYEHAPKARQIEIFTFLISNALKKKNPDIVRQNCYNIVGQVRMVTNSQVIIAAAKKMFMSRVPLNDAKARVAFKAGIFPYLKKTTVKDYFRSYLQRMNEVDYSFRGHKKHGELLRGLIEVGGLQFCPVQLLEVFLKWLVLCYIGERSFGQWAGYRPVFYSNVGAPLAFDIIRTCSYDLDAAMKKLARDNKVKAVCRECKDVKRRFQAIFEVVQ